jgi:hypothetical protein
VRRTHQVMMPPKTSPPNKSADTLTPERPGAIKSQERAANIRAVTSQYKPGLWNACRLIHC